MTHTQIEGFSIMITYVGSSLNTPYSGLKERLIEHLDARQFSDLSNISVCIK